LLFDQDLFIHFIRLTWVVTLLRRTSLLKNRSELVIQSQHLIVIHSYRLGLGIFIIILVFLLIILILVVLILGVRAIRHSSNLQGLRNTAPKFRVDLFVVVLCY
jgi:uncharacterized membrane protein